MRNMNQEAANLLLKPNPPGLEMWTQSELRGSALRCSENKWLGIIGNTLESPIEQGSGHRIGRCGEKGQGDGNEGNIIPSSISGEHTMRFDLARA